MTGARANLNTVTDKKQEPADKPATQKTLKGTEIPIPDRDQVMDDFKKIVQPKKG